jgi:hypothetical protein
MTERTLVARFALAWVVSVVTAAAQNNAADTATLIEALQLKAGSVVAEVGAGDGELTIAIAKHVGPTGRVFTTELGTERAAKLQSAVKRAGAHNVHVIEGKGNEANLAPPGKRGEDGSHGVTAETVEAELKAAGFELVSSKPGGEHWFIVVAAKPKA